MFKLLFAKRKTIIMNKGENVEVIDSAIDETANLGGCSTIIHSNLGEMCIVGKFSKVAYSSMGPLSYISDYSVVINSVIGKFSSISWGVTIGPEEHDYKRLTNHSFLYSLKAFTLTPHKHYSPFEKECIIGNDVWIGCNSTILRGVTIGDGAVVGANSLVNKNVEPYTIVVGSPAKVIKHRFTSEIITALLELKWWDIPVSVISEHTELFAAEPTMEIIETLKKLKSTVINKNQ
ncbi:MAG: hexapeptide repeat-containing transferase [Chitinophagaceae bacterium]|nr:hexapeptide repeat-containing transferase [Chitinophagaceae bacterium]